MVKALIEMKKISLLIILIVLQNIVLAVGNKTWNCINENGETVFTIEAIQVYRFKNGLARIYKKTLVNNQWVTGYGFIDKQGEIVIPCQYKNAKDFTAPVTWVKYAKDKYYQLIDKKGNVIPTDNYERTSNFYSFQQDMCAVFKEGKIGFINAQGKEIISCQYLGSTFFREGLASVRLSDVPFSDFGFINKEGEVVIPFEFRQKNFSNFSEGVASVTINKETVLINKKGKIVFQSKKGKIQAHKFGLALMTTKENGKGWGWYNFKDQVVIEPIYDKAENFNDDGFAIVEKDGLKGLIDTTGKVVLDFKYDVIYSDVSEDGYFLGVYPNEEATSLANSKKDYYDVNFNIIKMPFIKYMNSANNSNRIGFYDSSNDHFGYLDRSFNTIVPSKYKKISTFNEGLAFVIE